MRFRVDARDGKRAASRLDLRLPIVFMVLGATAVPIDLRAPALSAISLRVDPLDVVENIFGYVPVGVVLLWLGPIRALIAAACLTLVAETSQLFMLYREPSVIDVATNLTGALLGVVFGSRLGLRSASVMLGRPTGWVAVALSLALALGVRIDAGEPPNLRGAALPGRLEARWTLDAAEGAVALDASGHGLTGRLRHDPQHVPGVRGEALRLDGVRQYVDLGRSGAFRLSGSVSISAWFNASSFPTDDAAIVSNRDAGAFGYQLDATTDRGRRTLGFKLQNGCGNLMARYGATTLRVGTWYHAAGVYDAEEQSLHVYLNGRLDDGFLAGAVSATQRTTRAPLYLGRRSGLHGFEFAGAIDEVRLYSLALTQTDVESDMRGAVVEHPIASRSQKRARRPPSAAPACTKTAEPRDARMPGAAGVLGVLVAVACASLWPSRGAAVTCAISLTTGLALVFAMSPTLSMLTRSLMPLLTLAGALSVLLSLRKSTTPSP